MKEDALQQFRNCFAERELRKQADKTIGQLRADLSAARACIRDVPDGAMWSAGDEADMHEWRTEYAPVIESANKEQTWAIW